MVSWDRYKGGDNVARLPLRPRRLRRREPHEIPPRPWLYGTILSRGATTVLVAPGGVGKSQLALAMAADLGTGRGLLGFHIFQRVPVWYLNLEDDEDELDRRIAAFRLVHDVAWNEIEDWFFAHQGSERPVCMAKVDEEDGSTIVFPDRDEIIAGARASEVGAIWVDPFIKSHKLDENSNPQMDAALTAWTEVAQECECAIGLVHHVRKGMAVSIDAARGAKSVTDAARVGLLLSAMADEEAQALGIEAKRTHHFLRLDNAKANLAPAFDATWFEMVERNLGNATSVYPNGDTVATLTRWAKPSAWDALDNNTMQQLFDALRLGPSAGEQYTLQRSGAANTRWAGNVLMRLQSLTAAQATAILKGWIDNGVLIPAPYESPNYRKLIAGIVFDETKIGGIISASAGLLNPLLNSAQ